MNANESIQKRVDELVSKAAEKAGVTVERIVNELAKIAFSDIRKALDWGMKQTEEGPVHSPSKPKDNPTMADNSNDPVMQNQDVVQGARNRDQRQPARSAAQGAAEPH